MPEVIKQPPVEIIKSPEKEELPPEKVALLIRHPSVEWGFKKYPILEKAEEKGEDIETYTPPNKKGLRMIRFLSEYLQKEYLQDYLPKAIGDEKGIGKKYTIRTSPLKRAETEARLVSKNIKLAHTGNPDIPLPKNNEPIKDDCFAEIPWIYNRKEALALTQEAKEKNIHVLQLWFEKYKDEVIERLNKYIAKAENGLKVLDNSNTPIDIVFTHRVIGTLMLWVIEQRNKGRKDLTITKDDLPRIMELTGEMAYTSLSEIRRLREHWQIHSIGKTPHLDKEPELRQGTLKPNLKDETTP